MVVNLGQLQRGLADADELFGLARGEEDDGTLAAVAADVQGLEKLVAAMEFRRMFSNPLDPANAFVDIQSGSGGTEAQDWAQMLMRMYLKWADAHGFKVEVMDLSLIHI